MPYCVHVYIRQYIISRFVFLKVFYLEGDLYFVCSTRGGYSFYLFFNYNLLLNANNTSKCVTHYIFLNNTFLCFFNIETIAKKVVCDYIGCCNLINIKKLFVNISNFIHYICFMTVKALGV